MQTKMTNPRPYIAPADEALPPPSFGGLMTLEGNEIHELVFVEYEARRPCRVLTIKHWDHSGRAWFNPSKGTATGHCLCDYDFDYSRTYGAVYQHMSGCGGELRAIIWTPSNPNRRPLREFWCADGLPLFRYGKHGKYIKIRSAAEITRLGYKRLRLPRLHRESYEPSRNPFDGAIEGEVVYCRKCDDHLPSDHGCKHLRWCDECCQWFYLDSNKAADDENWICDCEESNDRD